MANPGKSGTAPVIGVKHHKVLGLPVEHNIIFSNHNHKYKPRIEKRQRKLIIKIPFIRPFLKADEKILLVTTGHSPPTVLEKWGIGWLFIHLKRSLLIFTNYRIFHVPTTSIYKYRNSIAQISYACCESIQMKGRSMVVTYKSDGDTEKFVSLAGKEKKKIREMLKFISFTGQGTGVNRRIHLCPQCTAPLLTWVPSCRKCGLNFKTGTVSVLLEMLLPGGGYFYLRQPFLGMITALLEICAMALIGISVKDMLNGTPSSLLWLGGGPSCSSS